MIICILKVLNSTPWILARTSNPLVISKIHTCARETEGCFCWVSDVTWSLGCSMVSREGMKHLGCSLEPEDVTFRLLHVEELLLEEKLLHGFEEEEWSLIIWLSRPTHTRWVAQKSLGILSGSWWRCKPYLFRGGIGIKNFILSMGQHVWSSEHHSPLTAHSCLCHASPFLLLCSWGIP